MQNILLVAAGSFVQKSFPSRARLMGHVYRQFSSAGHDREGVNELGRSSRGLSRCERKDLAVWVAIEVAWMLNLDRLTFVFV